MIVLARESRGMAQHELAEKIGMSKANLGKIENGDIGIKDEALASIAEATHYPLSFFEQADEIYPEHLNYRKRDKVAQKLLTPLNARVNIVRLQIQRLTRGLNIHNPILPAYEVSESNTPAQIAQKLRKS